MAVCQTPAGSRRRLFWSTQPDACGSEEVCGAGCGVPGLSYTSQTNSTCGSGCQCCPPATVNLNCPDQYVGTRQTGIATNDWLRGLIINMLMTDGRLPDTQCGYTPGSQGGHWSSSYIASGPTDVGTLMRSVPAFGRVNDQVNMVKSYAQATLERLVERGVAFSVTTEAKYLGNMRMQLDVTVLGRKDGEAKVGITGARLTNGWVWQ